MLHTTYSYVKPAGLRERFKYEYWIRKNEFKCYMVGRYLVPTTHLLP